MVYKKAHLGREMGEGVEGWRGIGGEREGVGGPRGKWEGEGEVLHFYARSLRLVKVRS